jgi:predicted RNA-binding protein with PUA-like domain
MNYWLIKSEGGCYSIDDLKRDRKTAWEGVRNFQARNFMRDDMKIGDGVLFYHSLGTAKAPSGVYGIAKVASAPYTDETQFKKGDEMHFDPKSKKEHPTWVCVDMAFVKKFREPITLEQIKFDPKLEGMEVRRQGSRLSIQPVSEKHFSYIAEDLAA